MSALARLARPIPTIYRVALADAVAYRGEMLIWLLSTNTPLIMLLLWTSVAAEAPVGRFGTREFVAYFLATLVVRLLTGAWVAWQMNMEIKDGSIAGRLLKPMHPFVSYALENLAAWPVRLVMLIPVLVVAFSIIDPQQLTHDFRQWLLFPVALISAWGVTFSGMLVIGTLTFFLHNTLAIAEIWFGMYVVFSGYIVPLELFPAWARSLLDVLPWPYILSYPVELLLGLHPFEESVRRLGVQWCWILGFVTLALWAYRAGLRRYEAFGG